MTAPRGRQTSAVYPAAYPAVYSAPRAAFLPARRSAALARRVGVNGRAVGGVTAGAPPLIAYAMHGPHVRGVGRTATPRHGNNLVDLHRPRRALASAVAVGERLRGVYVDRPPAKRARLAARGPRPAKPPHSLTGAPTSRAVVTGVSPTATHGAHLRSTQIQNSRFSGGNRPTSSRPP